MILLFGLIVQGKQDYLEEFKEMGMNLGICRKNWMMSEDIYVKQHEPDKKSDFIISGIGNERG